mmetsp:Transcript_3909/g.12915  ORF Transcript_3909/g.12915 Transcript_3909/m.12915 type:complete len:230 (-) Transcript_3909:1730-2419(-)
MANQFSKGLELAGEGLDVRLRLELLEDGVEHEDEQLRHELGRGARSPLVERNDARVEQLRHSQHGGSAHVVHVGELDERHQNGCHLIDVREEGLLEVGNVRMKHGAGCRLLLQRRGADGNALVALPSDVDRDRLHALLLLEVSFLLVDVCYVQFGVQLCRREQWWDDKRQVWLEVLAEAFADARAGLEHEGDLRVVGVELDPLLCLDEQLHHLLGVGPELLLAYCHAYE